MEHVHHTHLFTQDMDATIAWWCDMLGGIVHFDGDFGGSRNVFMHVGDGRLHFYDQRPRDEGHGAVHHVGIRSDDLYALHERLVGKGVAFRSGIREFGSWRYVMCPAPDNVLLELFAVDGDELDPALADYFLGSGWRERQAAARGQAAPEQGPSS